MLLYELGELAPPARVAGRAREADLADRADLALLADWVPRFATETGAVPVDFDPAAARRGHTLGARQLLWTVGDETVAWARHTQVIDGMSRVGPVYTAEPFRGKHFGMAVTAAASAAAQQAGADTVVLFTDADYAPSNAIYRRIGYRERERFAEWRVC